MNPHRLFLTGSLLPLASAFLCAQGLNWLSHFSNGQGVLQNGLHLTVDDQGNVYLAGSLGSAGLVMDGFSLFTNGPSDVLCAKLDPNGVTEWAVTGTNGCPMSDDYGAAIDVQYDTLTDQLLVTGQYLAETTFGTQVMDGDCVSASHLFLAAYDVDGNCTWVRGSSSYYVQPTAMLIDPNSDIHVFGRNDFWTAAFTGGAPTSTVEGAFVVHYSASGVLLGVDHVMNAGEIVDAAVIEDDQVVCGFFSAGDSLWSTALPAPPVGTGGVIARTSNAGVVEWVSTVSSDVGVRFGSCAVLANGKTIAYGLSFGAIYFANDTLPGTPGALSGFVALYDQLGGLEWVYPVSAPIMLALLDVEIGPDQLIYLYGKFSGTMELGGSSVTADASKEAFIARIDTTGDVLGLLRLGRTTNLGRGGMAVTEDGVYLSGTYDSTMVYGPAAFPITLYGAPDIFVAKFEDVEGFTGIESRAALSEELHIYANPNNGLCTIDLPQNLQASDGLVLSVYDQTGQLVQQAPLEFTEEGLKLDVRAQAKGIYHVELSDGQQRYSGRIVFE